MIPKKLIIHDKYSKNTHYRFSKVFKKKANAKKLRDKYRKSGNLSRIKTYTSKNKTKRFAVYRKYIHET